VIDCHVFLGQYGAPFSAGMYGLASRLRELPDVQCIIWGWRDAPRVLDYILKRPEAAAVLIGFSLGANSCTQLADATRHPIALLVAYDASVLQGSSYLRPIGRNVGKTLCYRSDNWLFGWGHGQIVGHNVTTVVTHVPHLAVCYQTDLHDRTVAAVKALID
jgi:hypothetical protein